MVVVISPAQAKRLLTLVLHASGRVPAHPVVALGGEEQIAGPVAAEVSGRGVEQLRREGIAGLVGLAIAATRAEGLAMLGGGRDLLSAVVGLLKRWPAVTPAGTGHLSPT